MKHRYAFRLVFLTILTIYLICNVSGTITTDLPIDTPTNITEHSEYHYTPLGSNNNDLLKFVTFITSLIILVPIVCFTYYLIPTWYHSLRRKRLTPVFYGSDYLVHPF
ncbi:hypothetical protein [Piscibacillus halophilus]|uniref:Uncharacterized protein n=1 Tax=Piscibacillus halophilus TaxID=571933 RepID=A0A1H9ME87_9BACI|nr:hypothetical protein [Piscibacillus halophilus]SER22018.1 hypothetical protein SAMN05216362_16112 [Piscibacillus halophilus]